MVLFLDFDGVLHPDPCPATRLFEHAGALADALAPTSAQIVLSTSWRSLHPVEMLKGRLPPALAQRVIGATPLFSSISATAGRLYPYPRQAECMAWLRERAPGREWHALDDRADWFEPYCERLTLCDARSGLTAESLAHLVSALVRPRRRSDVEHSSK
jgi:hypothetical protein